MHYFIFQAVILVLKEVHRVRNVQNGVETVIGHYSGYNLNDLFFVAVMIGSIRGMKTRLLLSCTSYRIGTRKSLKSIFLVSDFKSFNSIDLSYFFLKRLRSYKILLNSS